MGLEGRVGRIGDMALSGCPGRQRSTTPGESHQVVDVRHEEDGALEANPHCKRSHKGEVKCNSQSGSLLDLGCGMSDMPLHETRCDGATDFHKRLQLPLCGQQILPGRAVCVADQVLMSYDNRLAVHLEGPLSRWATRLSIGTELENGQGHPLL